PATERHLASLTTRVERGDPHGLPVRVAAGRRDLHAECDGAAVGRQLRVERDRDAVQVVGACGSRHEVLLEGSAARARDGVGRGRTDGWPSLSGRPTGYHRVAMAEQLT